MLLSLVDYLLKALGVIEGVIILMIIWAFLLELHERFERWLRGL